MITTPSIIIVIIIVIVIISVAFITTTTRIRCCLIARKLFLWRAPNHFSLLFWSLRSENFGLPLAKMCITNILTCLLL
jgi:hypothetical protein